MRKNTIIRNILLSTFAVLLVITSAMAQEKQILTRGNIFAGGFWKSLPTQIKWFADESGFLFNDGGSIYKFDVTTGEKKQVVEIVSLQDQLMENRNERERSILDNTNATGRFNRSGMVLSPDGEYLCGMLNDDLYLYNLKTGTSEFITDDAYTEEFQTFSPDSKKIAFLRHHDLYLFNLESGKETRLTDNQGEDEVWNGEADWVYEEEINVRRAFWWSPNSDKVAYLQFDTRPIEIFYLIDHLEIHPTLEKQKFAMVGGPNSIVKLGIVDISDQKTTWVDTVESDYYIYDADWNTSGTKLLYRWMNREQNKLELRYADAETGKSQTVVSESRDTWVNARVTWLRTTTNLVFLPDDSFAWTSDRDGFFHLYHYDKQGNLVRQLSDGDWQVEDIQGVSKDGSTLYFSATEASPLERNLYKVNIDGSGFTRITNEYGNNATNTSPSGTYSIVTNSAIDRQRKVSVIKTSGEEIAVMVDNDNPVASNFEYNSTKIVKVKADDGETLYGMLTLPPNFDKTKKYPVIIFVYGGPAVQMVTNSWSPIMLFYHQVQAAKGYVMFTLDNRGSWGRGHEFESKIHLELGDWELRDQIAGVKFLRTLPYVDADKIGITGGSYGGYMTLMAMFRAPEYFKVGVSQYPGTDNRHYDTALTERYMSTPEKNPEGFKAADCATYADGLEGPLLITHGMMDNNVHVQQVFQVIDALIKAGKDFQMMLYPRERHGISTPFRRAHHNNLTEKFFAKHLKGEEE